MDIQYITNEYKANNVFIYLWVVLMLTIFLSIFIGRSLGLPAYIGVTWIVCLFILPFVFEKKVKQIFTKKILLEFTDSFFSVTVYQSNDDKVSKQLQIKWEEIKSYKFYFSPAKNTILSLYLRDSTFKSWNFKDNKTFEEAIGGESLFNIFNSYIKKYNVDKSNDERISLNQGFLNSKKGSIIIYSEIVIILSGFIFHLVMHPQSSFLTLLIGFSLVTQQFLKRKQERAIYNKINTMV